MKHNGLQIYLHDHLAGAAVAINLLRCLVKKHPDEDLRIFASSLLVDIVADHEELKQLSSRIETHSAGFKEMIARFFEKLSRPKFHWRGQNSFGEFEAMEMLTLGISGKEALWTALAALNDPRVAGLDYQRLTQRAREQRDRVNQRRLRVAPRALSAEAN